MIKSCKIFLTLLFGAALAMGCTNDMGDDGRGGKEPLYEKENSNVMGTVTCDGYGVAGVVVSDGVSVTKTDKSGRYWLENVAVDREPEIFMSIPSGYETVERKGMGQAFYHRAANVEGVQTFNFTLKKVEQSGYELLVIADSHVLGGASIYGSTEDVNLYNNTFIPEYKKYAQKCLDEGRRVYSVHCGDMTSTRRGRSTTWRIIARIQISKRCWHSMLLATTTTTLVVSLVLDRLITKHSTLLARASEKPSVLHTIR